jgi:hypothetical protein
MIQDADMGSFEQVKRRFVQPFASNREGQPQARLEGREKRDHPLPEHHHIPHGSAAIEISDSSLLH